MEQLDIEGNGVFNSLKVSELAMIIRYQFKSDAYKKKGIKKQELKRIAVQIYAESEGDEWNDDGVVSEAAVAVVVVVVMVFAFAPAPIYDLCSTNATYV